MDVLFEAPGGGAPRGGVQDFFHGLDGLRHRQGALALQLGDRRFQVGEEEDQPGRTVADLDLPGTRLPLLVANLLRDRPGFEIREVTCHIAPMCCEDLGWFEKFVAVAVNSSEDFLTATRLRAC